MANNVKCSNCNYSMIDERWGDYKCKKHQRTCTESELIMGCNYYEKPGAEPDARKPEYLVRSGATFTPSVSSAGVLSWTNDKGLPNPTPVNIKGKTGKDGKDGVTPHIGGNGNWWIGDTDTGVSAVGSKWTEGLQFTAVNGCYEVTGYVGTDTNVIIPNTYNGLPVTKIASCCFNRLNVTSIAIPSSIITIGDTAFDYCPITSLYIYDITKWCAIEFVNPPSNPLLYSGGNLYLNGRLVTELIIPDSVTQINSYAFWGCHSLKRVEIPNSVTHINSGTLSQCINLSKVDLHNVTDIAEWSFENSEKLETLILRGDSVPTLSSADALYGTKIAKGIGHIYVKSTLMDDFKIASNWAVYADQFRAIEDYPDITGG